MSYLLVLFSILSLSFPNFLKANCAKCDEIREYNRNHPENNYTYYDDYLKAQKAKQSQPSSDEKKSQDKPVDAPK